MARIGGVVGDAAAHVEQMATGPVPQQNVIFFPPPGSGDPGPTLEPPHPYLAIRLDSPVNGAAGGLASQGVVLTATGGVDFHKYDIQRVDVRFPGAGFVQAALNPNDGWTFTATSKPILTPGPASVIARVVARTQKQTAELVTEQILVGVNIVLADDVPPTVQITSPAENAILDPRPDGKYLVPLEVKVSDNSADQPVVEFQAKDGGWQPLDRGTDGVWRPGSPLLVSHDRLGRAVTVRAVDAAEVSPGVHLETQRTVRVRTRDTRKPTLTVKGDHARTVAAPPSGPPVLPLLQGSATDTQAGVKRVEFTLNGGQTWTPVTVMQGPTTGGKVTWELRNLPLPASITTIKVRALDNADIVPGTQPNTSDLGEVIVTVTEEYAPKDPTPTEYYRSLVDFVVRRIARNGAQVTVSTLSNELNQPLAALMATNPDAPAPRVAQLRVVLEALRSHFDERIEATHPDQAEPVISARLAVETAYQRLAYESILRRLGTSLDELAAALRGEPEMRLALAGRLGITLAERHEPGGLPLSNLSQFLLTTQGTTGTALERLFGLVSLDGDPLRVPTSDPVLLELQLSRLMTVWREMDTVAAQPIVDPDVIAEEDVRPGAASALALLRARQTWIDGLLATLRGFTTKHVGPALQPAGPAEAAPAQLPRFDALVAAVLVPVRDLLLLQERLARGESVDDELAEPRLSFAAFRRLISARRLAEAQLLTDADWEDVYAIVVQVHKLRLADQWCEAERGAGLHLGPAFFVPGLAARPGPPVPVWRSVPGARRRWQTVLSGRVEQQQTLRQALASAVAGAEEDSLPSLRDGLMSALAPLGPADATALTGLLLTDVMVGGSPRVTRVEHAIQTMQTLLAGVRTGMAPGWSRVPIEDQEEFDEELRWIGSYANWFAAMQVFLWPENHLQPTLRPAEDPKTSNWVPFLAALRSNRQLTPERAAKLAADHYGITPAHTRTQLLAVRAAHQAQVQNGGANAAARLANLTPAVKEKYYFVPMALALALHRSGQYLAALSWFRMVYAYDLPVHERKVYYPLEVERFQGPAGPLVYQRAIIWLAETLNAHDIVDESYSSQVVRWDVHTRFVVQSLVRCLLDFADVEFLQDTNESLPRARLLYQQALDLLAVPELNPAKVPELSSSEVVATLRWRAQAALAKLRAGRNLAGHRRQLETVTPIEQGPAGSPLVIGNGPFGSGSLRAYQPTPYRYATLVDRAKLLAGVAQQIEQSYLSALEKRDAEAYSVFKAEQDIALASANTQLQALRAAEAADHVVLADLQRDRAAFQVAEYQKLLDEPMNSWEKRLLGDYKDALTARNWIAGLDAALTAAQAVQSMTTPWGIGGGGAAAAIAGVKAGFQIDLNNIETDIQRHSLHASVENRVRDWQLQQGVARKDEAIGDQQLRLARDQQAIVEQERKIAELQLTQARAVVAFLANKFTNVELYEWMVDVLQGVYAYFLRQATATAQLAQHQLAFESQERVPALIRKDYWQPSDDAVLGESDQQRDRQGLTGSARLLQDVYQLDQFAFDTSRRKLQLSRTISLARLSPLEFQRFRQTGSLTFATPMSLFDQDFPGHYLRLVKRVRLSVVALVPAQEGIRATLSNPGVSRVVVGGDSFQTVRLTRDPESVALSAPTNASGVFELDPQPELLQPFELSGVDTIWNLELPRAANPFDFRTIADVLITVEYTALPSLDLRRKAIAQLDRSVTATRAYGLRDAFPDQWFDLHNAGPGDRLSVELPVRPADFPAHVDEVTTEQLTLLVVLDEKEPPTPVRVAVHFTPADRTAPVEGEAVSTSDGVVSTRIGNAAGLVPMLRRAPFGTWRVTFPDAVAVRALLERDAVLDVALLLSWSGRTPEWPD